MVDIGRIKATIGLDTRPLVTGAAQAKGAFRGLSAGANKLTRALGPLGVAAGTAGTAILGLLALRSVIKTGAQFEQTMATVQGVLRATSKEMAEVEATARMMGETTKFTATQAGDALKFLAMTGFSAKEAIEALPGVLDLAAASDMELARTADIASNVLKTFQLETKELGRVNDVFVGTMTRSNVNMEQMAESMKFAGPVANAFGFSIEETAGLIGKLGDAGIQGSMAGTQLAFAMTKANKVAGDLGLESSDLIDVLKDLNDRGADASDIMRLFGLRGGRAALILRDMIPEVRELQHTLLGVSGEAKDLAEKKMATLTGAWLEFKSAIESVAIDAFNVFGEQLNVTLREITAFVRNNKEQFTNFVETIVDAMKFVDAVVTTARQNLALIIGQLQKLESQAESLQLRLKAKITRGLFGGKEGAADVAAEFEAQAKAVILQGEMDLAASQTVYNQLYDEFIARNVKRTEELAAATSDALTPPVSHKKGVARGALGEAGKDPFDTQKTTDKAIEEFERMQDQAASAFKGILESGTLNATALRETWTEYAAIRENQIRGEAEMIEKLTGSAMLGQQVMVARMAELAKESEEVFKQNATAMEQIAEDLGVRMRRAMESTLFAGLKGDFDSLKDHVRRVFDEILFVIVRGSMAQLTDELSKLFNFRGGGGGGAAGFFKGLFGLQAGGLVMGPTPAIVGEAGPELVLPLDKLEMMRDRKGGGDVHVQMNVTANDLRGFSASQAQLAMRAGVAMGAAVRRNG